MISFTVYGSPIAQPRQRHTPLMKAGKPVIGWGGRPVVVNYTPKTAPANQWKTDIKNGALLARKGAALWEGPVRMNLIFYLPRPKSLCRKKDPDGPVYHAGVKDIDNLYKAVADALEKIIYRDDGQIAEVLIAKFYHEKDRGPRAEISLWQIGEEIENPDRDDTTQGAAL